jgi:hypothetical protein
MEMKESYSNVKTKQNLWYTGTCILAATAMDEIRLIEFYVKL